MKKKNPFKSLLFKNIVYLLLCSTAFLLFVTPVVEKAAFNALQPFLVEYTTLTVNKGATLMSNFLALSNQNIRLRTRTPDFQNNLLQCIRSEYSKSEFPQNTENFFSPLETSFSMENNLDFFCISYPAIYIEGIGLFSNDSISAEADEFIKTEWFMNYAEAHPENSSYMTFALTDSSENPEYYFCFLNPYHTNDASKTSYYTILFTKLSDILPLWNNILELGTQDYAFLGGMNNEIIYQNLDTTVLDIEQIREQMLSDNQHLVVSCKDPAKNGMIYSVLVSYQDEGLRFIAFVGNNVFDQLFQSYSLILRIIILTLAAIFILLFILLLKQIFKRLTILAEKMTVVQHGDYNVILQDTKDDEIGQLAHAFNIMTEQIRINIDQITRQEKQAKILQYNLMVSAINPHFIYNTLNTSNRLAELGRIKEVVKVNDALINFLRDNLKLKNDQAYDTIRNEIDALKQYIIIQNYLCDNTITLQYHISEEDMELRIPKFLLQPLVENAILHGIVMHIDSMGNTVPGIIDISVEDLEEHIRISVKDNGIGMSKETLSKYFLNAERPSLDEENRHEHIGILIIHSRLSHLYEQNYTFCAKSSPGEGTQIIIEIPQKHSS